MNTDPSGSARWAAGLSTDELRREFLLAGLFAADRASFRCLDTDRAVVGAICPGTGALPLEAPASLHTASFLERREAGVVNLGGPGRIRVDGAEYPMEHLDFLYLGRGAKAVAFAAADAAAPARYWLVSYPAHASHPSRHVAFRDVPGAALGGRANANERTLRRMIHPGAMPTCQLVMGVTRMAPGSVWNTMPTHTHDRRTEVYLYFDLPADQAVIHLMGPPTETRHLIVRDCEAVVSPSWSIHSGVGTGAYSFIWAMGGENQEFEDMDAVPMAALR